MTVYEGIHKLELLPGSSVTIALFRDVKNIADLKTAVIEGKIDATLLSPKMILSPFQVLVAANKTLHNKKYNKMKTRSVNSEVLFNLSSTNHITESFKQFGVSFEDTGVLVVILNDTEDKKKLKEITEMINGDMKPLDQLESCADEKAIKKVYKICDPELSVGSLLDAVVCRIAIRDVS